MATRVRDDAAKPAPAPATPLAEPDARFAPVPTRDLLSIGLKCLSTKTLEAVNYLNSAKEIFPDLVLNISEFKINQSDYYEMILTEKPTKIILKNSYFSKQIFLLKKFNDIIKFEKGLEDYKYVDLRYKNQIVVKERI